MSQGSPRGPWLCAPQSPSEWDGLRLESLWGPHVTQSLRVGTCVESTGQHMLVALRQQRWSQRTRADDQGPLLETSFLWVHAWVSHTSFCSALRALPGWLDMKLGRGAAPAGSQSPGRLLVPPSASDLVGVWRGTWEFACLEGSQVMLMPP